MSKANINIFGVNYMSIIIFLLAGFTVFIVERKAKLRSKYQIFASKFTLHYIDFLALIILVGIGVGITFMLSLTPLPSYLIEYIRDFCMTYSIIILLPN